MNITINHRAVRALIKAYATSRTLTKLGFMAHMDAQFSRDRATLDSAVDTVTGKVAERFGMTASELNDHCYRADQEHLYRSLQAWTQG